MGHAARTCPRSVLVLRLGKIKPVYTASPGAASAHDDCRYYAELLCSHLSPSRTIFTTPRIKVRTISLVETRDFQPLHLDWKRLQHLIHLTQRSPLRSYTHNHHRPRLWIPLVMMNTEMKFSLVQILGIRKSNSFLVLSANVSLFATIGNMESTSRTLRLTSDKSIVTCQQNLKENNICTTTVPDIPDVNKYDNECRN